MGKKYKTKTDWKSCLTVFQDKQGLGFWLLYDISVEDWKLLRIGLYSTDREGYESNTLADWPNNIQDALLNKIAISEVGDCLEFELDTGDKNTIMNGTYIGDIRRGLWEYFNGMAGMEVIEYGNVTVFRKPIKPISEAKGKQVLEKLGEKLENIIQSL